MQGMGRAAMGQDHGDGAAMWCGCRLMWHMGSRKRELEMERKKR